MSEQILLLNPRRRKRRHNRRRARARSRKQPAGLRKYWATRRRSNPRRRGRYAHARRHNRRRSHARRSSTRRYAHARRHNRHHRYARRHNRRSVRQISAGAMATGRGMLKGFLLPIAVGGVGGVVLDIGWGYLSPRLPTQFQTGWASLFAKLGVILLGRYAVNRYAPRFRAQVDRATFGAGAILAYGALRGLAKQAMPSLPLSGYVDYQSYSLPGLRGYIPNGMGGYMPRTLGSLEDMYSPAAVIQPPGTPVPQQFGRLSGYIAVQPHVGGSGGLMGYDWAHDGM